MFNLTFFGGVSEIGGNKILLDFNENKILLDFGISYEKIGNFFDEFLQPRANAILEDLIYLKLLPPIPGIYREDLLNTQFKNSSFRKILLSYKDYLNLNKKKPLDAVLFVLRLPKPF
ncbi:MAG: hypothetical protein HYU63_06855 [Armatimonadetes bacterium]|nr:hypothetical protein [Armatimonadota bacterium]